MKWEEKTWLKKSSSGGKSSRENWPIEKKKKKRWDWIVVWWRDWKERESKERVEGRKGRKLSQFERTSLLIWSWYDFCERYYKIRIKSITNTPNKISNKEWIVFS